MAIIHDRHNQALLLVGYLRVADEYILDRLCHCFPVDSASESEENNMLFISGTPILTSLNCRFHPEYGTIHCELCGFSQPSNRLYAHCTAGEKQPPDPRAPAIPKGTTGGVVRRIVPHRKSSSLDHWEKMKTYEKRTFLRQSEKKFSRLSKNEEWTSSKFLAPKHYTLGTRPNGWQRQLSLFDHLHINDRLMACLNFTAGCVPFAPTGLPHSAPSTGTSVLI